MKKKADDSPKTAVGKLMFFIEGLEAVLHPRIMDAMKKLVWDARTELAQEAKNQLFSPEMQELEPLLNQYRDAMTTFGNVSRPQPVWHMRPIIEKIIQLYAKGSENIPKKH